MWPKIAGGVILYGLAEAYNWYSDDVLVEESSKYNSLFAVANRLEKVFGGNAYVGLRIPDADTVSRQDIDIVLVTEGKAVVISVKDISGIAAVFSDCWVIVEPIKGTEERLPNPVVETKRKASILKSYLDLKGVALPEGYFSCYVVLPKPNLRIIYSGIFPSEVITYDQWEQLKPEQIKKSMFSGCAEGAFRGREEMQRSIHQKFDFILSTAPMWDRQALWLGLSCPSTIASNPSCCTRRISGQMHDHISIHRPFFRWLSNSF
ncbi:uncharacterized protein LOC132186822 isoform X2 [Corylus avellana]|uniref:uncharacterized protein LOC132186822 isoform X2 n=1 Tax=Corylus avellana TaxID=13451 RepID=UPI00286A4424|nr:uncharacterized protein LOC132186822 isoform X2 [Corylus avellana]